MLTAQLIRQRTGDQGTEGQLKIPALGLALFTMELPWRGNASNLSCIPDGTYPCRIRQSQRFGRTYHVMEVAGRSYILMHAGNWAGDSTKGLRTNSHGCILLGLARGVAQGQRAVLSSRPAVRRLVDALGGQEFQLIVSGGFANVA